jgi:hypothetical protein
MLLSTLIRFSPYESPEAGAGGGAASGTGGAAGAGNGASAPAAAGTGTADAGAAAAAGSAAAQGFTYKEDRSGWVDPDRYKKAEAAVNRTATELERARQAIAERDRKIAALAGVTPPNPDDVEAQKIADAFFALPQFAHLKHITPEFLQQINALVADGASIADARDHVWNAHTDRFLSRLDDSFADEIGVETLSPGQQRKLRAAFGALIPDQQTDPDAYAKFKARYEASDETLIADFVKEYVSDMLEPARRQATVTTTRRPVPRSGPPSAVVTSRAKPDYAKMSVQEMLDAAEKEAEALGR